MLKTEFKAERKINKNKGVTGETGFGIAVAIKRESVESTIMRHRESFL